MTDALRILMLEQSGADATRTEEELARAGMRVSTRHVDTEAEFLATLESFAPELILAEFQLPGLDGLRALELASYHAPGIPTVILTNAQDQATAVACMKAGAADYVLKSQLPRLGPAVAAALERKRAQEERWRADVLHAQLERAILLGAAEWRSTFDAVDSPILILDDKDRIVRLNAAARELAGVPFEALIGRAVTEISAGAMWRDVAELLPRTHVDAPFAAQVLDANTGRTYDVAVGRFEMPEGGGQRRIIVLRDVTHLMEMEASVRRSETMSAMGALVAGVAHEVRNPLFGLQATVDAFAARFGSTPEYERYLGVMRTEVERLSALMRELLEYGRPPSVERIDGDIGDVIGQAVRICAPLVKGTEVSIMKEGVTGLPHFPMDPGRLVQVFHNLIVNAVQHSPAGSVVTVTAEYRPAAGDGASGGERKGTGAIVCRVADAGPGFRPDDMHRLFEPFFSRRRGGTGLGLSIVQRIVDEHGGDITVGNRPEGGALVTVEFPLKAATGGA